MKNSVDPTHCALFMLDVLPPNFIQFTCKIPIYKYVFSSRVKNSVDPNQLASERLADVDLHCCRNKLYPCPEVI